MRDSTVKNDKFDNNIIAIEISCLGFDFNPDLR